jgi:hypothetical protein
MKRRAQGQVFATGGLVRGVTAANAFRYLEVLSDLVSWRQRHPIALRLCQLAARAIGIDVRDSGF